MRRYLLGLLGGAAGTLALLAGGYYTALGLAPERVPAPAITRLEHLDEKLAFLRARPDLDPTVLAIGSSMTWRQFDGSAFVGMAGGEAHVLNGGTAFLKTHQTRFVADFYLDHFPHVRTVIQITNVPDFRRCHSEPAEMFDREDAAAYAFEREPALPFYLRYFAPYRYLRTAKDLPQQRRLGGGELALDHFGSGPIGAQRDRGLFYGPIAVERDCIAPLVDLARRLAVRNIHYVIVFAPVHPAYFAAYPAMRTETEALVSLLRAHLHPDETEVIAMQTDPGYRPADFYDAFHLHWPAVKRLSRQIADRLQARGTPNGAVPNLTSRAANAVAAPAVLQ